MTDLNRPDSSNLDAIKSDGTVIAANRIMTGGSLTVLGCTLVNGTTYFFPFGAPRSAVPGEVPLTSFQLRWDAAIILTATVETTLIPAAVYGADPRTGTVQLSDFDVTAGFWLQQNPSGVYVPITGGTATALTISVPGGSAGGCELDLGNFGPRRGRVKIVVGGTGGVLRGAVWGKAAA